MKEKWPQIREELWSWLKTAVVALVLIVVVRSFLFVPIVVDGKSMDPTLHDRERLFLNKIPSHMDNYDRFDIVVFQSPDGSDYIKRIIGLPGDHVAYKNDVLYINGKPVDEPFLEEEKKAFGEGILTLDFTLEEATGYDRVPEGTVFVLGDNRDESTDSRIIGCIDYKKIKGTASVVFYPFKEVRIAK
ncbi:MAG: signal peptidase I [Bacilli bacterium]